MIGTVAGSAVVAAGDDDRERTFLVSDLHVPVKGGRVLEDLGRLLARAAAEGAGSRLVFLGDLFDSYVGARQLDLGAWKDLTGMLHDTVAAGVSVATLCGNRDFLLDPGFEARTGVRVVNGGLRLLLDGRPSLLLHGDELCLRDHPYQRGRRLLRHPMTRGLVRLLPLWLARTAAERVRGLSRKTIASGDRDRFRPPLWAVEAALSTGAERVVFGHIHICRRGRIEGGGEYWILPAFDETGVYLQAGPGALRFFDRSGEPLADPRPESFT